MGKAKGKAKDKDWLQAGGEGGEDHGAGGAASGSPGAGEVDWKARGEAFMSGSLRGVAEDEKRGLPAEWLPPGVKPAAGEETGRGRGRGRGRGSTGASTSAGADGGEDGRGEGGEEGGQAGGAEGGEEGAERGVERAVERGKGAYIKPDIIPGNPGNNPWLPHPKASVRRAMLRYAALTPAQLAKLCLVYARELRKGGDGLTFAELIAVRMLMAAVNDPDGASAGRVLDRIDGKVQSTDEDIQRVIVQLGPSSWRPNGDVGGGEGGAGGGLLPGGGGGQGAGE